MTLTKSVVSRISMINERMSPIPWPGTVAPSCPTEPNISRKKDRCGNAADRLSGEIAGNPMPGKIAPNRKSQRDRRVKMGAAHRAHEIDDRHHHHTRRDDFLWTT